MKHTTTKQRDRFHKIKQQKLIVFLFLFLFLQLSLADLKLSIAVHTIVALTQDQFVSESKTPGIWAVCKKVNAIPSYVAWRETEAFKTIAEGNIRIVGV